MYIVPSLDWSTMNMLLVGAVVMIKGVSGLKF